MSFHRWMGSDVEDEDQCLGCGVVTPDFFGQGLANHGPLPIFCPGPEVKIPHHFGGDEKEITCHRCGYTITDGTMPNEVNWECQEI